MMTKPISIVMTYWNRPHQLELTLKSLKRSSVIQNAQIIIVDDASDAIKRALPVIARSGLNVDLIEIKKEDKTWRNPCVPYNMGIKRATGNIIVIQNSECFHVGDLLLHVLNKVTNENYLTYSCFCIDDKIRKRIEKIWDIDYQGVIKILDNMRRTHPRLSDWKGWYNHIEYNPRALHWMSAITAKNLRELGGFNEQYREAPAYDDNDFLLRIKIKGLDVKIVSEKVGYVVHQKHPKVKRERGEHSSAINRELFIRNKIQYEQEYRERFGKKYAESDVLLLG